MKRCNASVILVVATLVLSLSAMAQTNLGFGVKLVGGNVPFVIANVKARGIGIEGGVGYSGFSLGDLATFSTVWYLVNARLYFPIAAFPVSLYLGAGVEGVIVTVGSALLDTEESASAIGLDILAGLEFSAMEYVEYGVPLVVFGGIDFLWMSLTGIEDFPFSVAGPSWHIGLRLEI